MADETSIPPGSDAPPPFPKPPASLEEYEAIPLAREPPDPRQLRTFYSREAAQKSERLLARIARARGAVEIFLGEGLAALDRGDRLARLCYSSVGDYAREALGIGARTAQGMVRLARELRERPLLREAVRKGEIGIARAQAILAVARGEAEAGWVERAGHETVRELERAARNAGAPEEDEETWRRLRIHVEPEDRAKVDRALEVAGKILGPTSSRWERLESMAQEYLGSHASKLDEDRFASDGFRPLDQRMEALEARLEAETERWSMLEEPEPYEVPGSDLPLDTDAQRIDWHLGRKVPGRARRRVPRHLGTHPSPPEDAVHADPRAGRPPVPGPGLQPAGHARPPQEVPGPGRRRRAGEPGRHVQVPAGSITSAACTSAG